MRKGCENLLSENAKKRFLAFFHFNGYSDYIFLFCLATLLLQSFFKFKNSPGLILLAAILYIIYFVLNKIFLEFKFSLKLIGKRPRCVPNLLFSILYGLASFGMLAFVSISAIQGFSLDGYTSHKFVIQIDPHDKFFAINFLIFLILYPFARSKRKLHSQDTT